MTRCQPCDRLIDALHPWTSYVIVPLFALANAGIALSGDAIADPESSVLVGVAVALVAGKLSGSPRSAGSPCGSGSVACPTGPVGATSSASARVAGIGFTVSLFITGLAFDDPLQDDAKIGILAASIVSALAGTVMFVISSRKTHPTRT